MNNELEELIFCLAENGGAMRIDAAGTTTTLSAEDGPSVKGDVLSFISGAIRIASIDRAVLLDDGEEDDRGGVPKGTDEIAVTVTEPMTQAQLQREASRRAN